MRVMTRTPQTPVRRPVALEPPADLSTERVVMRPLGYRDEAAFRAAVERSRPTLRPWFPLERRGESPADHARRVVESGIAGDADGSACRRGVFTYDGAFVGMVNLINIERGMSRRAEINFWIDDAHARRGAATHAVDAMAAHALTDLPTGLGLDELRAFVCLDNEPSRRLMDRLGFQCTDETDLLDINGALVRHHAFVRRAA